MNETSRSRYREIEARFWRERGAEPREQWVDVPRHGIRVRVLEVGSGEPLLFVHGITTAGSMWADLVARLQGHRCLVLDRPGCGLSQPLPADRVGSLAALVDVQTAVLAHFGLEAVDAVGSSLGGACVLALAVDAPGRVRRIVLEGSPAIAGITLPMHVRLLAAGSLARYLARRRLSAREVRWYLGRWGHGELVAGGWPAGAALEWMLSLGNDTDTQRNDVATVQSAASWRAFRTSRLFDPRRLPAIDCPALWLWGSHDPLATVEQGRAWARSMPSGTFELLDAGHVPCFDDPAFHARRIEDFLRATRGSGSSEPPTGSFVVAADERR